MSRLARWLARLVWGHMLWTMRRPLIRRLRRDVTRRFGERSWERVKRQDRFARRYGLFVLQAMMTLLIASIALTTMFLLALWMAEQGLFQRPSIL